MEKLFQKNKVVNTSPCMEDLVIEAVYEFDKGKTRTKVYPIILWATVDVLESDGRKPYEFARSEVEPMFLRERENGTFGEPILASEAFDPSFYYKPGDPFHDPDYPSYVDWGIKPVVDAPSGN